MLGETISHYEILEKLGQGGMGVVYKARDTKLDRTVAIKLLPPHLSADKEARKRFILEAKAASAIDHQHICTIYEIDETDEGSTFIVMAFYEGETLRARIDRGGITDAEALSIASQAAEGLAKAHGKDIVHRDIKPRNIIITDDGVVKIIDFGLAKLAGRTKLTRDGSTLGTAAYMSPEQARGEEVDGRSDIFSLGTILYEMLAGGPPFRGEHEAAVLYGIVHEEPVPLPGEVTASHPGLQGIVDRALEKDADERFQSIDDMAVSLDAIRDGTGAPAAMRPSGGSVRRARRRVMAAAVSLLVIAAAAAGYMSLRREQGIESVAVLPLMDISGDDGEGGFADGMTGALRSELGQISDVRWTSLYSVMKFKDAQMTVPEFCERLGVDAALVGSIDRDSSSVILRLELVEAGSEDLLWSSNYERDLDVLSTLYSRVALDLVEHLQVVMNPEAAAAMASRRLVDPDADDACRKGNYYLRNLNDLDKSLKFFNRAVESDPTYAKAWAGLAETYIRLSHGATPTEGAVEKALEAVNHALELDSTLGEAYHTKGHILWEHVWDGEGAEEAFEKAFELNPSNAYGNMIYAYYLLTIGEPERAADAAIEATKLDPLSWFLNGITANEPIAMGGRIDEAIKHINSMEELFPDKYEEYRKHDQLSNVYLYNGSYDRAIEEWNTGSALFRQSENYDSSKAESYLRHETFALARTNAMAGNRDEAARLWTEYASLVDIDELESTDPFVAATYHIWHKGDRDKAFEILDKAYEDKNMWLTRITVHPWWEPIRSDPRYDRLVKGMGLR